MHLQTSCDIWYFFDSQKFALKFVQTLPNIVIQELGLKDKMQEESKQEEKVPVALKFKMEILNCWKKDWWSL